EPTGRRSYFGGVSEANAARTVLRDTFITRAIILIGNPSARCNRRISAQSSTDNTPCLPPTLIKARRSRKGSKFGRRHGVSFQAARTGSRAMGPSLLLRARELDSPILWLPRAT